MNPAITSAYLANPRDCRDLAKAIFERAGYRQVPKRCIDETTELLNRWRDRLEAERIADHTGVDEGVVAAESNC